MDSTDAKFDRFAYLPSELQALVWDFASLLPKVFTLVIEREVFVSIIRPSVSLLQVCSEARRAFKRQNDDALSIPINREGQLKTCYLRNINLNRDTFFLLGLGRDLRWSETRGWTYFDSDERRGDSASQTFLRRVKHLVQPLSQCQKVAICYPPHYHSQQHATLNSYIVEFLFRESACLKELLLVLYSNPDIIAHSVDLCSCWTRHHCQIDTIKLKAAFSRHDSSYHRSLGFSGSSYRVSNGDSMACPSCYWGNSFLKALKLERLFNEQNDKRLHIKLPFGLPPFPRYEDLLSASFPMIILSCPTICPDFKAPIDLFEASKAAIAFYTRNADSLPHSRVTLERLNNFKIATCASTNVADTNSRPSESFDLTRKFR